ncbi:MFS transporter, partial [Pseudonocardia pini]|uniref:MFS transporter n=1 Tax=Pseudonocardia pini TaxID=2758030 RepID=UPI0015F0DE3F
MTGQFRLLVLARTISWFGSAVTLVALPIAVYQRTGDAGHTAALTAVESTPYLLLGLLAGAVADRWPRRPTMVVTGLVAAAAVGSVPLAQALGVLSTPQLYVAAFVANSAMVFFDAAGFGLLPALVPREQLELVLEGARRRGD